MKTLDQLDAYQLALDFKLRVYAIVDAHPAAGRDLRYRGELFDAALSVESNIAEGWRRFGAGEMSQFLRYALGSLEEAQRRLRDGVHRGHFTEAEIREAMAISYRCGGATTALWKSIQPFAARKRRKPAPAPQRNRKRGRGKGGETEDGDSSI